MVRPYIRIVSGAWTEGQHDAASSRAQASLNLMMISDAVRGEPWPSTGLSPEGVRVAGRSVDQTPTPTVSPKTYLPYSTPHVSNALLAGAPHSSAFRSHLGSRLCSTQASGSSCHDMLY